MCWEYEGSNFQCPTCKPKEKNMKEEIEYFWKDCRVQHDKGTKANMTKFKNFLAKETDVESLAKLITVYWFQGFDEGIEFIGKKVKEAIK